MPTSARMSLGFFGQFADVGIRAPAQNGLLQQALTNHTTPGQGTALRWFGNNQSSLQTQCFCRALHKALFGALIPSTKF